MAAEHGNWYVNQKRAEKQRQREAEQLAAETEQRQREAEQLAAETEQRRVLHLPMYDRIEEFVKDEQLRVILHAMAERLGLED